MTEASTNKKLSLIHMEAGATVLASSDQSYKNLLAVAIYLATPAELVKRRTDGDDTAIAERINEAAEVTEEEAEQILTVFTEACERYEMNTLKRAGIEPEVFQAMKTKATEQAKQRMSELFAEKPALSPAKTGIPSAISSPSKPESPGPNSL